MLYNKYTEYFERCDFMNRKNLFFYNGEGIFEKKQIVFNSPKKVMFYENDSDLFLENIKSIEIEPVEGNKIKIKIGPNAVFHTKNRKVVVNIIDDDISIEIICTDERLKECVDMVHAQESKALADYIIENAPNVFHKEKLDQLSLSELKEIRENLDDLANCY